MNKYVLLLNTNKVLKALTSDFQNRAHLIQIKNVMFFFLLFAWLSTFCLIINKYFQNTYVGFHFDILFRLWQLMIKADHYFFGSPQCPVFETFLVWNPFFFLFLSFKKQKKTKRFSFDRNKDVRGVFFLFLFLIQIHKLISCQREIFKQ